MIYFDESTIKIGGVILPGLFKSIEIKGDALIEEQEIEGRSSKSKQAIGYEDSKVNVELILHEGPLLTKRQKLEQIQNIFKKQGQSKPIVYEIVNEHTAARGISKVLFKNLTTKEQSKKDELTVMIEFWEYIPITITATNKTKETIETAKKPTVSSTLTDEYKSYLNSDRGSAPKIKDKTNKSPATDSIGAQLYRGKLKQMPY